MNIVDSEILKKIIDATMRSAEYLVTVAEYDIEFTEHRKSDNSWVTSLDLSV